MSMFWLVVTQVACFGSLIQLVWHSYRGESGLPGYVTFACFMALCRAAKDGIDDYKKAEATK